MTSKIGVVESLEWVCCTKGLDILESIKVGEGLVVVVKVVVAEDIDVIVAEMIVPQHLRLVQPVLERSHEVPERDPVAVLVTDVRGHLVGVEGHALVKFSGADGTDESGFTTNGPVEFGSCLGFKSCFSTNKYEKAPRILVHMLYNVSIFTLNLS